MPVEQRGLSGMETQEATKTEGLALSLSTPERVQKLQTALHDKAKEAPNFRFYALYDKVYRKDVLAFAYECCKANGGAAGVDGQTIEDIEAYGEERWLDELAQELKKRTYQPLPVRRVYIPKPDGKQRPLTLYSSLPRFPLPSIVKPSYTSRRVPSTSRRSSAFMLSSGDRSFMTKILPFS